VTDLAHPTRFRRLRRWVGDLVATSWGTALAAAVVALTAVALWIWRCAEQLLPGAFWRSWWLQVPDLLAAVVVGLVGGTVLVLLAGLMKRRPPWLFVCAVVFGAILLLTMGAGASLPGWVAVAVITLAATATLGWWLAPLVDHGRTRPGRLRWAAVAVVGVLALLVAADLAWAGPGAAPAAALTPAGAMADPTMAGPFRVTETAYGSGTYTAEAAYGPDVPITTPSVDASRIIGGWTKGSTRAKVWGFTAAALPLNARVWAPQGAGPFPLVLILHGNSAFTDSETGFAYLGTLLASRGYLVASIDENFLNTGLLDKAYPITGADAARAWLLLAHLHLWHTFNDTPASPFTGKVDLDHVSLIGHSRGGEAVAVAASRATELGALAGTPPDPDVRIRTVIALAPSDGQFDKKTPIQLTGINYLTLAGTYDADVSTFAGARQYARTKIGPNLVKAAVSIGRGNHTQFNTQWGRYDVGLGLAKHVLDTAGLLSPTQQRQAAKAYISAFLELTIHHRAAARPLFDQTATGMSWLPATTYIQQYATGPTRLVQQFPAGSGATRSPIGTVKLTGASAGSMALPTRTGPSTNHVLELGWKPGTTAARYTITAIPARSLPTHPVLTADIANATAGAAALQVTITDAAGHTATVPFGEHPQLTPLITGSVLKPPLPGGSISEPPLQTFQLPLATATGVDPTTITSMDITFTAPGGGSLYLDNIGVTSPPDR